MKVLLPASLFLAAAAAAAAPTVVPNPADAAASAAARAASESARLASWITEVAAAVRVHWRKPQDAPREFTCHVQVEQAPGGKVVSAKVEHSCGSAALDESVVKAVLAASPLPAPRDASTPFQGVLTLAFCPDMQASCR